MQCVVEVESKYGYFVDRLCEAYDISDYKKSTSSKQSLPTSSFDYVFPSYNSLVYNICEALNVLGILYAVQDIPISNGSRNRFGVILHTA